ncbi:MAG: hypothetical protein BV457_03400 [Thermoplasmata archaeon M9B1D]|nr:MAG: hypothetical protein BV457_03400 [Thermoplasmata archaeon M9B1D]
MKQYLITRFLIDRYYISGYYNKEYIETSEIIRVERRGENYLVEIINNGLYLCNIQDLSQSSYYTLEDVIK